MQIELRIAILNIPCLLAMYWILHRPSFLVGPVVLAKNRQ
jgi:hypothetical protein